MPILQSAAPTWPPWCELEYFRIEALADGVAHLWQARHKANKLVVVEGQCRVGSAGGSAVVVEPGQSVDGSVGEHPVTSTGPAMLVELGGCWGADCGGVGVFTVDRVDRADQRKDVGDPVSYPKNTNFDRHYHDCDEYWIIVEGRGTASSEDVLYEIAPGACVATRMGDHHDLPMVGQRVRGVYFETTMRGQRRRGHLWEHTHGPAKHGQDGSVTQ